MRFSLHAALQGPSEEHVGAVGSAGWGKARKGPETGNPASAVPVLINRRASAQEGDDSSMG